MVFHQLFYGEGRVINANSVILKWYAQGAHDHLEKEKNHEIMWYYSSSALWIAAYLVPSDYYQALGIISSRCSWPKEMTWPAAVAAMLDGAMLVDAIEVAVQLWLHRPKDGTINLRRHGKWQGSTLLQEKFKNQSAESICG